MEQLLSITPLVKARFETPLTGCAPYTAIFKNTSDGGQRFSWDFGDGSGSTAANPVHDFAAGTYTVKLITVDSSTCNIADTAAVTITVSAKPRADFSHTPLIPETNKPVVFSNASSGAVRYKWVFGDGDSIVVNTVENLLHQYNETNTFNARLIAYNQNGCTDTATHAVSVTVQPLVGVPNAFTPGRFGKNSVLRVEGFGIKKMTFRIYNRWGQKIFETNDRNEGWDGTFNRTPQPMEVYVYTLSVEFFDGKRLSRQGDVTLIR